MIRLVFILRIFTFSSMSLYFSVWSKIDFESSTKSKLFVGSKPEQFERPYHINTCPVVF